MHYSPSHFEGWCDDCSKESTCNCLARAMMWSRLALDSCHKPPQMNQSKHEKGTQRDSHLHLTESIHMNNLHCNLVDLELYLNCRSFRCNITVMEAPSLYSKLLQKLKIDLHCKWCTEHTYNQIVHCRCRCLVWHLRTTQIAMPEKLIFKDDCLLGMATTHIQLRE